MPTGGKIHLLSVASSAATWDHYSYYPFDFVNERSGGSIAKIKKFLVGRFIPIRHQEEKEKFFRQMQENEFLALPFLQRGFKNQDFRNG